MKKNETKNTKVVKIKKIAPKKYNIKNNGKERVPIIGIFEKKEKSIATIKNINIIDIIEKGVNNNVFHFLLIYLFASSIE